MDKDKKPSKCNKAGNFLYNSKTGAFCSRTPRSWFKILLFYVFFYAFLISFWVVMLLIFYQTLHEDEPKWKTESGIIGSNPGVGFRPRPPEDKIDSSLIIMKTGGDSDHYVKDLSEFLKDYEVSNETESEDLVECEFGKRPPSKTSCLHDITHLSEIECDKKNNFGYTKGEPCVLLKLNKVFDWEPEVYRWASEAPRNMPESLREELKKNEQEHGKLQSMVWVSCEGEYPVDVENIGGVVYSPYQGLPSHYFPFENNKGYLQPLVAAKFKNLTNGIVINVECKAWARNIKQDKSEKSGLFQFQLFVDF